MALYPNYKLFIDVQNGVASSSFTDISTVSSPNFYANDTCLLNIYFVRPNAGSALPYEEIDTSTISSVEVAIGTTSAIATSVSSLTPMSSATASVTTVVPYSAGINQIDRISISPEPKAGNVLLYYAGNSVGSFSVNASADEVAALLYDSGISPTTAWVTKSGAYSWDVEWANGTFNPPYALTTSSAAIQSFTGYESTLDLTVAGVATLLAGASSAEATFEVATLSSSGTLKQTALHIPCTVYEDIL